MPPSVRWGKELPVSNDVEDKKPMLLLPPHTGNERASDASYASYTPVPYTHPAWNGGWNGVTNKNYTKPVYAPYWRRYYAILEKNNRKCFGKIVIQEDIETWAVKNGWKVIRSFRGLASINPEKERTEFTKQV